MFTDGKLETTMKHTAKTIRTFIGARNFDESRQFYRELGFEETIISDDMSLFQVNSDLAFYLQDYYVKQWVENSMIFLEVDHVERCWEDLVGRGVQGKYKYVRLTPIKIAERFINTAEAALRQYFYSYRKSFNTFRVNFDAQTP